MSSFLLDANGDVAVVNNSVRLTEGLDAIRQHLQVKFRMFLGEYFLDPTAGVPWYQEILVKSPIFSVIQEALKAIILNTPGVLALLRFSFDFNGATREAELDFEAQTADGPIDFSQIIEV